MGDDTVDRRVIEITADHRRRVTADHLDEGAQRLGVERVLDVVVDRVVDATFIEQGDRPAGLASIGVVVERQHGASVAPQGAGGVTPS